MVLNPNLQYVENGQSFGIQMARKDTLDGSPHFFYRQVSAGLPITLRATEDQGWLDLTMYNWLLEQAQIAGNILPLLLKGVSINVSFRHYDSPAIDLKPFIYRIEPDEGDYFIGDIKLVTV